MQDFIGWCGEKSYELPAFAENVMRAGHSQNYPDAYVRGQYPPGYFTPISATAILNLQNAKKMLHTKGDVSTK